MKEITETMELAKKHAVRYVEVPPMAKFEIRWSTNEPPIGKIDFDLQSLDGNYQGNGPMLIACLTD